jgi:hypothetical protein
MSDYPVAAVNILARIALAFDLVSLSGSGETIMGFLARSIGAFY